MKKKRIFNKEYHREWRKRNRESVNKSRADFKRKRKRQALEFYGGTPPTCACCGEGEYIFLCIDHIDGDGASHRREIKDASIHEWLFKKGFPEGFQVLCFNCNNGKSMNKNKCPHLTPKQT